MSFSDFSFLSKTIAGCLKVRLGLGKWLKGDFDPVRCKIHTFNAPWNVRKKNILCKQNSFVAISKHRESLNARVGSDIKLFSKCNVVLCFSQN